MIHICAVRTGTGMRSYQYILEDGIFNCIDIVDDDKSIPPCDIYIDGQQNNVTINESSDIDNLCTYSKIARFYVDKTSNDKVRSMEFYAEFGNTGKSNRDTMNTNMTILRILMICQDAFICHQGLKEAFMRDTMHYLKEYFIEALRLANNLDMKDSVNLLLKSGKSYIIYEEHGKIWEHNHDIRDWDAVKYWRNGYRLIFRIITRIVDYYIFEQAIENGMGEIIEEIHEGSYLNNYMLNSCTKLKILNIDFNPFVTELGPSSNTLEELHCGRTVIDQEQLNLCKNLKRLYINDNPYIYECPMDINILHMNGNCKIPGELITYCSNLVELSIVNNRNRITLYSLPCTIRKLIIDIDSEMYKLDMRFLEHLELFITKRLDNIYRPKQSFMISENLRILTMKIENIDPDFITRNVSLNEIITPNYTSDLKILIHIAGIYRDRSSARIDNRSKVNFSPYSSPIIRNRICINVFEIVISMSDSIRIYNNRNYHRSISATLAAYIKDNRDKWPIIAHIISNMLYKTIDNIICIRFKIK